MEAEREGRGERAKSRRDDLSWLKGHSKWRGKEGKL